MSITTIKRQAAQATALAMFAVLPIWSVVPVDLPIIDLPIIDLPVIGPPVEPPVIEPPVIGPPVEPPTLASGYLQRG